jgi:hypothetical protein
LAGRIISASHVAFASTRVMATSAYVAQAVGMSARICKEKSVYPADILKGHSLATLQKELQRSGQYIPGVVLEDAADLVKTAKIQASSELLIKAMDADTQYLPLNIAAAQLVPLPVGDFPAIRFNAEAEEDTQLTVELRSSLKPGNFTPDNTIASTVFDVKKGSNSLTINFEHMQSTAAYVFLMFRKNPKVRLQFTEQRITGMLSVFNLVNKNVSNYGRQTPTEDIGVDEFEFWCPQRRPNGLNIALDFTPGLDVFKAENIRNGTDRPSLQPNAWVVAYDDASPKLTLEWDIEQSISSIHLVFDTDYDHPMETVLIHHPESVMPFCVRNYSIHSEGGTLIYQKNGNYQSRNIITLAAPVSTKKLIINIQHPSALVPAALFAVRCYA